MDERLYNRGWIRLAARRERELSLVDGRPFVPSTNGCVTLEFALDAHFEQEGFTLLA